MDNLIQVLDGLGAVPPTLAEEKALIVQTFPTGVKGLQSMLGVDVDGVIGPKTRAAIKNWQGANNVTPTGIWDTASRDKVVNMEAVSVKPPPGTEAQYDWSKINTDQLLTPVSIGPKQVTPTVVKDSGQFNKLQTIMDRIKGKAPYILMAVGAGIILYAVTQKRAAPAQ